VTQCTSGWNVEEILNQCKLYICYVLGYLLFKYNMSCEILLICYLELMIVISEYVPLHLLFLYLNLYTNNAV